LPEVVRAVTAPAGSFPGASERTPGGMPSTTQWWKIPPSASKSAITSASSAAWSSTPDHESGGDRFSPSHE
jgi:hypothetical protein